MCPQFKEYFYNSNERNIISLYEDMLRQDSSITLHPLKAPWMMDAFHQHYVKGSIKSLTQVNRKVMLSVVCVCQSVHRGSLYDHYLSCVAQS